MILNTATEIDLVINKDNSSDDDDELFKVDFKRLSTQQMPKKSTSNKVFGIHEGKNNVDLLKHSRHGRDQVYSKKQ